MKYSVSIKPISCLIMRAFEVLKILALSNSNLKKGNYKTADKTFKDVRKRIDDFKKDQIE